MPLSELFYAWRRPKAVTTKGTDHLAKEPPILNQSDSFLTTKTGAVPVKGTDDRSNSPTGGNTSV